MTTAVATQASTILVTPSVHYVVVSEVPPEANARTAKNVAKSLVKAWQNEEHAGNLQRIVASELGNDVNASELEVTVGPEYGGLTEPFTGKYGKWEAAHIVYPRMALKLPNGSSIETQIRTYVQPYQKGLHRASLNWASVDAYYDPLHHPQPEQRETAVKPDALQQTLRLYRRIATALSQHEFETMKSQGEAPQPYRTAKQIMTIDVTTLGVQDERLKELFQLLSESSKRLGELLPKAGFGVDELLSSYLRAMGFDGDLANLKSGGGNLFSTNIAVLGERYIEHVEVLYLLVANEHKGIKAFAVGYDRGVDTSMAAEASFKIAEHIKELFLKPAVLG